MVIFILFFFSVPNHVDTVYSFKYRKIFTQYFHRDRLYFEGWHSAPSWPEVAWRRCLLVWPFDTELIDRQTNKRGWPPAARAHPLHPRECRTGQSHADLLIDMVRKSDFFFVRIQCHQFFRKMCIPVSVLPFTIFASY